nr:HAMP domain-containing sensor histidine kinase [Ottowia thiooxydans]
MHASALNVDLNAALTDAKNKGRQKIEVLGYIGHDLRAPLATISGYSKLLLTDANEIQHKLLLTIQRSVKYQLDLIDELLEYAQAELQPLAVQPLTTDLPLLLDEISEYAIALCSQQNNRFRYYAPERIPRELNLDGKRLQQVLLNLLSNAAKFTHDGVVGLSVIAKPEGDTCALHFSVSDTGIGIDLNQKADIFGAFQNIQAASGSTGLGLFIAQRIVSAMGGSLSVESISGKGTTFSFVLWVPFVGSSESNWSAAELREVEPAAQCAEPTMPRYSKLDDQVLDELASLALHGRLTDIERWIERHANEAAHAPFVTQLRDRLERFDFTGVQALALHNKNQSNQ